ncbi:MAG: hypothetical protein Q9M44_06500 [Ghiorsea sp.]|nr:hypothetical protein [Ghiorsea sp.]
MMKKDKMKHHKKGMKDNMMMHDGMKKKHDIKHDKRKMKKEKMMHDKFMM